MMNHVSVAYSGVHQAYQIALAAEEMGELDQFFCSVFDAPGKWGGVASRWFGRKALLNRRCEGIPAVKVREHPWPWVFHAFQERLNPWRA